MAGPPKKATDEGYTIVWVDEAGFYLLPLAVRTWAPRGQTPILRVPLTHDHLSAISGITLDGRLYMQVREEAFDAQQVVGFLRVLLRKIAGKVLVIWDSSPIHKGKPIRQFLAHGAAKRLHLERLPGYAPELNPDEGIWNYLKRVELKNRCCRDLAELHRELRWAKERLRHKRDVIRASGPMRLFGLANDVEVSRHFPSRGGHAHPFHASVSRASADGSPCTSPTRECSRRRTEKAKQYNLLSV